MLKKIDNFILNFKFKYFVYMFLSSFSIGCFTCIVSKYGITFFDRILIIFSIGLGILFDTKVISYIKECFGNGRH